MQAPALTHTKQQLDRLWNAIMQTVPSLPDQAHIQPCQQYQLHISSGPHLLQYVGCDTFPVIYPFQATHFWLWLLPGQRSEICGTHSNNGLRFIHPTWPCMMDILFWYPLCSEAPLPTEVCGDFHDSVCRNFLVLEGFHCPRKYFFFLTRPKPF